MCTLGPLKDLKRGRRGVFIGIWWVFFYPHEPKPNTEALTYFLANVWIQVLSPTTHWNKLQTHFGVTTAIMHLEDRFTHKLKFSHYQSSTCSHGRVSFLKNVVAVHPDTRPSLPSSAGHLEEYSGTESCGHDMPRVWTQQEVRLNKVSTGDTLPDPFVFNRPPVILLLCFWQGEPAAVCGTPPSYIVIEHWHETRGHLIGAKQVGHVGMDAPFSHTSLIVFGFWTINC